MASQQHPNAPFIRYDWDLGEPYKAENDDQLRALGAVLKLAVASRTSNQPGTLNEGDRYIHNGDASWSSGTAGDVLAYIDGTLRAYTPDDGWMAKCLDEEEWLEYSTTAGDWITFASVLHNDTATTDPAPTDDSTAGYSAGSRWYNTNTGELWRCVDATAGAAVWVKTTLTLDELGSAATKDSGTASGEVPTNADLGSAAQVEANQNLRDTDTPGWGGHSISADQYGALSDTTRRGAAGPLILTPDPLRMSVEASTGGRMTVLYDANDLPSYMVVIPRFRYEDLGYSTEMGTGTATAFTVGGVDKAEILIGAYQASDDGNGNAVVVPGGNPWVNIDYDASVAACTAKGTGWHLMTAHEWAAVALWCMANGFEPRGNTNHGRAHDATHEVGVRQDGATYPPGDSSGIGNTLTGSGPDTWRHDGGSAGIADLVGNVWEWQLGLKLVDGEVFAIADNQYDQAEANWPTTGRFYQNDTGTPTLADSGTTNQTYKSVGWSNTPLDGGYTTSQLLRRLLVEPAGVAPQGRLYVRDYGERLPRRGGYRDDGGNAGLAALSLYSDRGVAYSSIGFRPAFVA